jgi:hypothetical protein
MNNLIEVIRDANDALGIQSESSESNNNYAVSVEITHTESSSASTEPVDIETITVESDSDAKKKFYYLLFANEDFQKRLASNKSIIKRKNEYFNLI